ncbi:MAG TPA: DUF1801 domain-containing protein [Thermoanaerobaculia bacterium]|nr:DUF1801 domain-containing protein [Thermoanaerobaculia bacterium]
MAELKTKPTESSVEAFLGSIADEARRKDCLAVAAMMKRVTGSQPKMWGNGIVGFGEYHYVYDSGREGDWFLAGFSPRKNDLTLYIMSGFEGSGDLMKRLGKYKTGKSCLYVKKLADIDAAALEELIAASVRQVTERYGQPPRR